MGPEHVADTVSDGTTDDRQLDYGFGDGHTPEMWNEVVRTTTRHNTRGGSHLTDLI